MISALRKTADRFAITIEDAQERFDCAPDETLLTGMVRLGRRGIPAGGCGVCKIEVRRANSKLVQ